MKGPGDALPTMAQRVARSSPVWVIGRCAADSLRQELETYPKPGLVSHVDRGSHDDMDAATFHASANALEPYFVELAMAGARGESMQALRRIGLRAERAMLEATHGVNTHRGAIFGLGLLCAAAGWCDGSGDTRRLGDVVATRWGEEILIGPRLVGSHGEVARRRHGAGGARQEAATGFPGIYATGLPALRHAAKLHDDAEAVRVHACMALIAHTEDTNLLHRGGRDGLHFARQSAAAFLRRGGVGQHHWRDDAIAVHRAFVERRLSPGGAADLLAMSLFVQTLGRDAW
ncbi:triphosphoribosyl-dephospho-CoA synthase MdcB [Dyella sp.]|uniref:triphosphoribosyl-dephospho-CoA synthase MdcB n=1 Tax=Dyella sp. TaxID=1869338 RepID=UPI002ED6361E